MGGVGVMWAGYADLREPVRRLPLPELGTLATALPNRHRRTLVCLLSAVIRQLCLHRDGNKTKTERKEERERQSDRKQTRSGRFGAQNDVRGRGGGGEGGYSRNRKPSKAPWLVSCLVLAGANARAPRFTHPPTHL